MIAYSASQAISPAIDRTKRFLFQRFRFWTFFKLALVAALTDGGGSSFGGNIPSGSHPQSHSFLHSYSGGPLSASDFGVLVILPAVLLGLALMLWIWYLLVRLRFAYFHCVLYGTRRIRDGWRPYAGAAMRMFQLYLAAAACVLVGFAALLVPCFFVFRGAFGAGAQPDVGAIVLVIAVAIPVVLALVFLSIAFEIITHDFMLPHMALENATVGEAWRISLASYKAEKGPFWLYGLLRVVLTIAGGIAALLALLIPGLVVALVVVAIFVGLNAALANASSAVHTVLLATEIVLAVVGAALGITAGICLGGSVATWKRQYALLFYGGRYRVLGDLLSPPSPPALPEMPVVV